MFAPDAILRSVAYLAEKNRPYATMGRGVVSGLTCLLRGRVNSLLFTGWPGFARG